MSKDLGVINDYKARYLAKQFVDELNGKFTYDELYRFSKTIAPRPDAIELMPQYAEYLQTIDSKTLQEYSKLQLGTVLHGKIKRINGEGIKASHDLICVEPGIDTEGIVRCTSVTSQNYHYTTPDGTLKEGMMTLQPGDIAQRGTNRSSLSQTSYTGKATEHPIYPSELLVLLKNPTFQNYHIKPNKLRELLGLLNDPTLPQTLDKNNNPIYETDTLVYPTTNKVGTAVKPTIYFNSKVDNSATLSAIVDRLNRFPNLNPDDYMFRTVTEVNYKSLRDTDGTPEVTKQAFLSYVKEAYTDLKQPKEQLYQTLTFCERYSHDLISIKEPRNTILYISHQINKLEYSPNIDRFLEQMRKDPTKILELKLANPPPRIYR